MFMYLTRRARRAEEARVARFLHAIDLSGRYTLDPGWTLHPADEDPVPASTGQPAPQRHPWLAADRTDTVALPRIILAGTPL